MKRPIAVVLTAVLLGLFAALKLLGACGLVAIGFITLHKPFPTTTPIPYSSSGMAALFFGMAVLAVGAAAWMIVTLVGLIRMRSWARYSVLVIAGLMTAFGGILTLSSLALPLMMHALPSQPGVDLNHVGPVFLIGAAVYGIVTAIGIALLVYFNLARTRELFRLGQPVASGPPNTSTGKPRPTAVTVISWLYLASGAICLLDILLPYPTFLFGFVLRGGSAHLFYAAMGLLMLAIGYGLLRLRNEARLAVFGLFILCPLQMAVLLTPWGMRQFHAYADTVFSTAMSGGLFATNPFLSAGPLLFFSVLGLALYGIILWLLHRHREAFTQTPPAPPMPIQHEPLPTA